MPPLLHPRLVNDPAGDPSLFIPFMYEKRAILFDAGDLSALSPRDILKISHVFITHTHMDHFIGFDRLVRIGLGRPINLHVFGPEGFIDRISAKLDGYSWNLVENYDAAMVLSVHEVKRGGLTSCDFSCRERFEPTTARHAPMDDGVIHREAAFSVEAALLDHDIQCAAYAVKERLSVNIRKEMLAEMGLTPGPWLNEFKQALYAEKDRNTLFEIPPANASAARRFTLGDLADRLALITNGRKIAYITDAAFTDENITKMTRLAKNADHLFIEAAFLEADREKAFRKKHLTARQAGWIAASAGVKRFSLFHFSPRYSGQWERFSDEAMDAFVRATPRPIRSDEES